MKLLYPVSSLESDNGKAKAAKDLYSCRNGDNDMDSSASSTVCPSVASSLEEPDYGYGEGSPDSDRCSDHEKASNPLRTRSRHYARPSKNNSSKLTLEKERSTQLRGSLLAKDKETRIVSDPCRSSIRRRTSSRTCRSNDMADTNKLLRRGVSRSRSTDDSLVAMARSVSHDKSSTTKERPSLRAKSCEDKLLIMARSVSEGRLLTKPLENTDLVVATVATTDSLPNQTGRTVKRGLSRSNSGDGSRRTLTRTRSSIRASRHVTSQAEPSRRETLRSRSCQDGLLGMSRSEHKTSLGRAQPRRSDSTRSLRVNFHTHDSLLGTLSSNHLTKPRRDQPDSSEDDGEESVTFHEDTIDDLATSSAPDESMYDLSLSHIEEVEQWFSQRKFQRHMEAEREFQRHQNGAAYVTIQKPADLLSAPAGHLDDLYCSHHLRNEGEDPSEYAASVQLDLLKPDAVEVLITRVVAQDMLDNVGAESSGASDGPTIVGDTIDGCFSGRQSAATDNNSLPADSLSSLLRKSMFKKLLRVPACPEPPIPGYWHNSFSIHNT